MAKRNVAVCRLCRREGVKLFLKGARCDGPKCSISRHDSPPGMHAWRRSKLTEYGIRLREKQKAKRYYGIGDKQFLAYFATADRQKGNTGENLFRLLELRLDNTVYRTGWGLSRRHARQLVSHGHIFVNGRRVNRPSCLLKPGDVVTPQQKAGLIEQVKACIESTQGRESPSWVTAQQEPLEVRIVSMPPAEEVGVGFRTQLIVELCSR